MKRFCFVGAIMIASPLIDAKSTTQLIGDGLAAALPAIAYGATLYHDDKDGQMQFYKSYGTTIGATYLLKYSIREKRPDTNKHDSFPSGHTSSAFSAASFIHMRYGLKYAILPYLAAAYTGYTRVHSNRHYTSDVIGGAVVGMLSSWYFVTPYKHLTIKPVVCGENKGLQVQYRW